MTIIKTFIDYYFYIIYKNLRLTLKLWRCLNYEEERSCSNNKKWRKINVQNKGGIKRNKTKIIQNLL